MNGESQRTAETKERIRNAFFSLYATKKIERISIKEITELAQLNRGTFYVYYKDIYDLLEKTEDELIEELIDKIGSLIKIILQDGNLEPFFPPAEFYQRYGKILQVLLGANGDPHFVHKIKGIMKKLVTEVLQEERLPQNDRMEYVLEYLTSAQLGIVSYWLIEKDMSLSVAELGGMIKEITLHGPVNFLKSQREGC